MTRDEIFKLKAGRELDALIAERVMGLVPCTAEIHDPHHLNYIPRPCHSTPKYPDKGGETRPYSTDITYAWEVVEKIIQITELDIFSLGGQWFCDLRKRDNCKTFGGPSAPLAICQAALLAVSGQ